MSLLSLLPYPAIAVTYEAVDALRLGHADGLIFESWHSAHFWLQKVSDSRTRLLAPFSRVVHWGLPESKIAVLRGKAKGKRAAKSTATGGPWPRVLLARRGRDRAGANPAARVFIMVANGNARKGYEAAFEATRLANHRCGERVRGPRIFLLGVGVTAKTAERDKSSVSLYALAEKYGDFVELVRESVDPLPLLAASDAFISNGIHGGENFGLSLMEAMASGVPVLATSAGGATEQIIHDVHGFLYASGEVLGERNATVLSYSVTAHARALARAMCVVVREPDRAARWGAAGRKRVQTYLSEARIMHEFGLLVTSLLHLPGRSPDTSLPEEDPRRVDAPLTLRGASQWSSPQSGGGEAPARRTWVAAAAMQRPAPAEAPPLGGRLRPALLGHHAVYALAPPAAVVTGAPLPPLSLFALDASSQTWRHALTLDQLEFPRAGAGLGADGSGSGAWGALVVAGGVVSDVDACATVSASTWIINVTEGASGGGGSQAAAKQQRLSVSRLPDLPALLVRPVVVLIPPGAKGRTRGTSFAVHVLGGAPVDGDRALSGLHWRLDLPAAASAPHPPPVAPPSLGPGSSPAVAEGPWKRLADVPLPALEPAIAAVPVTPASDHDGTASSSWGRSGGGGFYVLGGRIGGPRDPLALGKCEEEDENDDADDEEEEEAALPPEHEHHLAVPPHPLYGSVTTHPLALAMSTALYFDPSTGAWAQVADLPVPVWGAVAVAHAGRILVLGGRSTGGILTDALQQYVPADDRWHVLGEAPLPAPSAGGVAWLGFVAPHEGRPQLSVVYAPAAQAACRDILREPPSARGAPQPDVAERVCRTGVRPWPKPELPDMLMQLTLEPPAPLPSPSPDPAAVDAPGRRAGGRRPPARLAAAASLADDRL